MLRPIRARLRTVLCIATVITTTPFMCFAEATKVRPPGYNPSRAEPPIQEGMPRTIEVGSTPKKVGLWSIRVISFDDHLEWATETRTGYASVKVEFTNTAPFGVWLSDVVTSALGLGPGHEVSAFYTSDSDLVGPFKTVVRDYNVRVNSTEARQFSGLRFEAMRRTGPLLPAIKGPLGADFDFKIVRRWEGGDGPPIKMPGGPSTTPPPPPVKEHATDQYGIGWRYVGYQTTAETLDVYLTMFNEAGRPVMVKELARTPMYIVPQGAPGPIILGQRTIVKSDGEFYNHRGEKLARTDRLDTYSQYPILLKFKPVPNAHYHRFFIESGGGDVLGAIDLAWWGLFSKTKPGQAAGKGEAPLATAVPSEALERLAGTYRTSRNTLLKLSVEGSTLVGQAVYNGVPKEDREQITLKLTPEGQFKGEWREVTSRSGQTTWVTLDLKFDADGKRFTGQGRYTFAPTDPPFDYSGERMPDDASAKPSDPVGSRSDATQSGASDGFTSTGYFMTRVEAVARRGAAAAGPIDVTMTMRNDGGVRRGMQNNENTWTLIGSDGVEYKREGNDYGRSASEHLKATVWLEKGDQALLTYAFHSIPPGVKPVTLVVRDYYKKVVARFDLSARP